MVLSSGRRVGRMTSNPNRIREQNSRLDALKWANKESAENSVVKH